MSGETEHSATTLFRDYIRINTMQPNPDYKKCILFLQAVAEDLGLPYKVTECVPDIPVMVITWAGSDPSLPAVMLNSHTDVVPVFPEHWTHPPFAAHKDEKGNIYGRGTQDMKCVGIQHIEAVRRLREQGRTFKRTIHLVFVPEEEVGGLTGMKLFVKTPEFTAMNVGFGLDEGIAGPGEELPLFYGERNVFWVRFTCPGSPGHGSMFLENTAGEKAQYMINKMLAYRGQEKARLQADPNLTLGDVTSVNLTIMKGGVQVNVVPDKFEITFDIRITPTTDLEEFEKNLRAWTAEAGPGLEIEFLQKTTDQSLTSVAADDPWYSALAAAFTKHKLQVKPQIFPAGTDSRYLREVGIPAIGFSPMNHTPILLHDHDEFLNEKIFLRGIDIFTDIIANIADV